MPAFQVLLDDRVLATVATEALDLIAVHVTGSLVDSEFAELRVDGGKYPVSGESTYLVWVDETPLRPGQKVAVTFLESGATDLPGRTLEEIFRDEGPKPPAVAKSRADIVAGLRAKPWARPAYVFSMSAGGQSVRCSTEPGDHGFAFHVLWNSHRPEQARVSFHTYTLANLEEKTPGRYALKGRLQVGHRAEIAIDV